MILVYMQYHTHTAKRSPAAPRVDVRDRARDRNLSGLANLTGLPHRVVER